MIVSGKHLKYTLYIEGVRVPLSSFGIQNSTGQGVSLSFDLLPLASALKFIRGMQIHLFKKEGNGPSLLRFSGILKNVSYSKNGRSRSVKIEAGSPDARWDHIAFAEFDNRNICSAAQSTLVTAGMSTEQLAAVAKNKAESWGLGNNQGLGTISSATPINVDSVVEGRNIGESITGLIFQNEPLRGPLKYKYEQIRDPKQFYGAIGAENALLNKTLDKDPFGTYTREAYLSDHAADIKDIDPKDKKLLIGPYEHSLSSATSLRDAFMREFYKAGGDVLEGLIRIIKTAYKSGNPVNVLEFDRLKLDKRFQSMSWAAGLGGDLFKIYPPGTRAGRSALITDAMTLLMEQILGDASGATPLREVVNGLLGGLMSTVSIDPTNIEGSMMLHPIMMSFLPPKCNVIFPGQYSDLMFNPNKWANPTRSVISFPASFDDIQGMHIGVDERKSNQRLYLCDSIDPFLRSITPLASTESGYIDPKDGTTLIPGTMSDKDKRTKLLSMSKTVTDEEAREGVFTNYSNVVNPVFARMDAASAYKLADFIHYMQKFGVRSCAVMGELLDDLVVGLPILVLDGSFSIYGIFQGYSYSVDQSGTLMSELVVSCPQFIFEETLPTPPMWLDLGNMSPQNIGVVYKRMIGCDSVYDATACVGAGTPTEVLRRCSLSLMEQYLRAADKTKFRDSYRKHRTVTEEQLFTEIHGCHGSSVDMTDKSVVTWQGDDFNPYQINPERKSLMPAVVDKQAIVLNYLTEYYGKPGRLE